MASSSSAGSDAATANGAGDYRFFDRKPARADELQEVLQGLMQEHKALPPKFFYDEAGSRLFEAITELPEYYLTRTELGILQAAGDSLSKAVGERGCVIEYGSGSTLKIRRLLDLVSPRAYVPVDISRDYLQLAARALQRDYPALDVYPTCADYSQVVALPEPVRALSRLGFFPGSSIGNFSPDAAAAFLANAAITLEAGALMLVGVDCKKDPAVLEAAYDDAAGVTARFNLNLLTHLNRTLGADFATDRFAHEAHYDEAAGCVRMHLRSLADQVVHIGGQQVAFAQGERLHTENSFKYHPAEFIALAEGAGFELRESWFDEHRWFGLYLLAVCPR